MSEKQEYKSKEGKQIPKALLIRYAGKAENLRQFLADTIQELEGEKKNVIDNTTVSAAK